MDVQGAHQLFDSGSRSVGAADDIHELGDGVRVVLPECHAEAAEDLVNPLVSVPEGQGRDSAWAEGSNDERKHRSR